MYPALIIAGSLQSMVEVNVFGPHYRRRLMIDGGVMEKQEKQYV